MYLSDIVQKLELIKYRFSSFVCQHTYFSLVGLFSKHHNSFSLHDILNIHWTVEQRLHANYGGSATTFYKNKISLSHDRERQKYSSDIRKRGLISHFPKWLKIPKRAQKVKRGQKKTGEIHLEKTSSSHVFHEFFIYESVIFFCQRKTGDFKLDS